MYSAKEIHEYYRFMPKDAQEDGLEAQHYQGKQEVHFLITLVLLTSFICAVLTFNN